MFTKLFESLDEKVFTAELKSELSEQFNAAVANAVAVKEVELIEKSETIIAEKIEEKIQELEEKAEEFQAKLAKETEVYEAELLDQVDAYLEKVVEDFITEVKGTLDESIKSEKADMIIESMDAMLIAVGTDIAKIVESKDSSDAEDKLAKITEKYDVLIEENIKLEKEKIEMMKMGIIAEMKEGLDVVSAEKFGKLANLVEFEHSVGYIGKLETIKDSIGSSKKEEKIEEKIEEKTEEKKVAKSLTTSFSHLL